MNGIPQDLSVIWEFAHGGPMMSYCLIKIGKSLCPLLQKIQGHDDVIKWKHFPRYWPFVRGIHRSPVNSLHKGQWRGALMFSLICTWTNGWVNNRHDGNLRCHRAHYDVTVMTWVYLFHCVHLSVPLETNSCLSCNFSCMWLCLVSICWEC